MIDTEGRLRDLSGHVADIAGPVLADLAALRDVDPSSLPLVAGNPVMGAAVAGVGKFICIGLNYSDHAESGMSVPPEPVIFAKYTSAICGPNDPIIIPRGSVKTDWEVELGFVIGKPGKYVAEAQAMDHVAGFMVCNDVSERAFQLERSGQWSKGKSSDNFGPIGPWLVTRDEVADPGNLRMWLDVNGKRCAGRQHCHDGLHCALPGQLPVAVLHPASGRCGFDRHAASGGDGHEAAAIPEAGGRG